MAALAMVDASVVCDCGGGTLTVSLFLMAADGGTSTFEITNPYTHQVATVIVPPGGETVQTLNLLLAAEWLIPVTVDGVNYDIVLEGCCVECLCSVEIFLEAIEPTTFLITHPASGEVFVVETDCGWYFSVEGLGPGTWVIPIMSGEVDLSQTVQIDPICSNACPPLNIQGFVPCRADALLGDGRDLRVLIMTRGASAVVAELSPTSGNFTRELDATSTLTMTGVITGSLGDSCCQGWEDIRPWATEVLVFRDGRDAWCGPVTDVLFEYGKVTIQADDLTSWWDRRVLPTLAFEGIDLGFIFQKIHEAAMEVDPSPNIFLAVESTGIIGTRHLQGSTYTYASDVLGELAKTDLDYCAYGRTVLVRGPELNTAPYIILLDEHWSQPPSVHESGNDQATVVVVRGAGVQSVAIADAAHLDYYGYLVRTFDESTIHDQASCDQAAQSRLDLLKDCLFINTPVGAQLKTTAPITLPQLIPGMRLRVEAQATCRRVAQDFRLQKVSVDFDGKVAIDLQPIGTLADILGAT